MFKPTSRDFCKTLFLSASFIAMTLPVYAYADGDLSPQDIEGDITAVDDSTVVYGQEFIHQQSGAITALDLVRRIPGGTSFLRNNNGNQRGFSNNDDPILINGQRISGKSNSSQDVLGRLAADQVLRLEVIRGSSPDIKISSQGALLNVVMHEDAGGSGSWNARANIISGVLSGALEGSYTGKSGILDYTAAFEVFSFKNNPHFTEKLFDGTGVQIFDNSETDNRHFREAIFSSNMTINLNNGEKININGQLSIGDGEGRQFGNFLEPDILGDLTVVGESQRINIRDFNSWEVGADYDHEFSDNWELKLVALHSQESNEQEFGEDFSSIDGVVERDFVVFRDVFRAENVGRAALVWAPSPKHRLEFGTELAFNERTTDFTLLNLEEGVLVRDDVASTLVTIKEMRDESFAIHSWQINSKLSLDSAVTYEYSKLTQSGNLDNERSFNFVKPSFDLRYNMSPKNQFQLSARKEVSQLNFRHFASSLNSDNQIIGGNANLSPEKSWVYEASYEHRLDDDKGYIKPSVTYERFSNKLTRIFLSEGVSGVGNAGAATRVTYAVEGALRFFFIGLPNLQLSGDISYKDTQINDPFIPSQKIPLNGHRTSPEGNLKLRHDMPEHGFLWEIDAQFFGDFEFRDLNVFSTFDEAGKVWVNVAAEKEIFGGLILRVSYDNILNANFPRERFFYEDGRAGGVLTNREERNLTFNRQLFVTLKGTF